MQNSSPPEPADRVARAGHFAQARRHLLQRRIAAVMPEGVVDLLEAVEVEEQQADGRSRICGMVQHRPAQMLVEAGAVLEAGQGVLHRQLPKLADRCVQLQRAADTDGQLAQLFQGGRADFAGFAIHDADRADRVAARADDRLSSIEAQPELADDERVVGEAIVLGRVRDVENLVGVEDGVCAERTSRAGFR